MPDIDMDWAWAIDAGWGQLGMWDLLLRLFMATFLGGLIGLERERLERAAGLRTHALVSVASALIMIVSTYGFPLPPEGVDAQFDPGRLAAQVVSGIGFLGAGMIIFRENTIRGLTTAATVWSVAGVGLAAGSGLYAAAIVGTGFMLLILAGLKPLERRMFPRHARQHRVVLEVEHGENALEGIHFATTETPVRLRSLQFDHDASGDSDTVELTLMAESQQDILNLVSKLRALDNVRHIRYQRGSSIVRKRERAIATDDDDDEEIGNLPM